MSLHRNIWVLSIVFFILVALTFFLFWQSQQNTIPEPTELPEVPGIPDEAPQIHGEVDTSTWPTYTDPELGISFKYPTFGEQMRTTRGENVSSVYSFQYHVTVRADDSVADPDAWFKDNVDPLDVLIKQGTFTRNVFSNGIVAFAFSSTGAPLPDDYDPVLALYALAPEQGVIIMINPGDDNTFYDLGITYDTLRQYFLSIVESVKFLEGKDVSASDWQQATLEGVTIFYPPLWVAKSAGGSLGLKSPATVAESQGAGIDIPSDMGVTLLDNPEKMSVEQFIKTFKDGWYTYYANTRTETISGHHAVVVDDLSAGIPKSPIVGALIDNGNKILAIGLYNDKYIDDFNTLINSIKIAP